MFVHSHDYLRLHVAEYGSPDGLPVLFAHPLGLDGQVWNEVVPHLPDNLRLVCMDMRGHGQSEVPPPPYSMGTLVRDAETVCETLEIRDCVFVGNSIGGIIAQGLAAKRLDLVRALVLSGTAPKIGTREIWAERITSVRARGMQAVLDFALERWFSPELRKNGPVDKWRDALLRCDPNGYAGCSAAIAGTDFYTTTAALRLPVLVTAGTEDGSTPPDLVRELADLIPGSEFHLMRGSGHVPAADKPQEFAALLTEFLKRIGHA